MHSILQSKIIYFGLAILYAVFLYQIASMGMQLHLLALIVCCVVLFFGIKNPLFGLVFSLVAMNGFFNLVPRGLFEGTIINKTWDLGFFLMIVFGSSLLAQNYKRMNYTPYYLKVFSIFLIICIISFILTIIKYPFPLVDTIRSFRYYLGYLFIPFLLQYLLQAKDGEKALNDLLRILYIISFILLVLYNIQFLTQQTLFLGYVATQSTSSGVSYLRSIPNFLFLCFLFLWFNLTAWFLNKQLFPYGKLYILLCLSATLFTFTRGIYLSVSIMMLLIFSLSLYSKKYNATKSILFGLFGVVLLFTIFIAGYLTPFIERASTIRHATSLSQEEGTMWYRIRLVEDRIKLITKENPIFGLGFVHNKHGYKFGTYIGNFDENIGGPGLGCSDIAWGNIIYQTGWLGFGCFVLFIISINLYFFKILKKQISMYDMPLIDDLFLIELASILELLWMIIHTLTSDAFTGSTQNPALIFAIASFSHILRKQREHKENENIDSNTIFHSRRLH